MRLPPMQSAKISLPQAAILFFVSLTLLIALFILLGQSIQLDMLSANWQEEAQKADELVDTEPHQAIDYLLKAIKGAEQSQVDGLAIANLYFKLGILYIQTNDRPTGERYINRAIADGEELKQYIKVTDFCQAASWAEHSQYWKDHNQKPSLHYQEKAIETATKIWGPTSEICLWTMAQLCMDIGDIDKAQECVDKATQILATKNQPLTTSDYSCIARLYALQHKWGKSVDAFLLARSMAQQASPPQDGKLSNSIFQKSLEDANPDKAKYDFAIAEKLLQEKSYDKLENMAKKLRQNPVILPDGHWQIDRFYDALLYLDESYSEEDWQDYLKHLSDWTMQKPQSVTAKIALANAYSGYAWKARGNGLDETVSADAWGVMAQRLKKASDELKEACKLSDKCPFYYDVLAKVALGQRWPRAAREKMVSECQGIFPDYMPINMSKTYYLQTRCIGKAGECNQFITALADKAGGENGDIVYAQMIWYLDSLNIFENIFADNVVFDWQRAKHGLLALIKRNSHDAVVRKELISLALQADDENTVKHIMDISL